MPLASSNITITKEIYDLGLKLSRESSGTSLETAKISLKRVDIEPSIATNVRLASFSTSSIDMPEGIISFLAVSLSTLYF